MSAPPGALLARASQAVREADLARRHGYVSNLIGLIIEATGLQAEIGEVCLVGNGRNRAPVSAEVVGFREAARSDAPRRAARDRSRAPG